MSERLKNLAYQLKVPSGIEAGAGGDVIEVSVPASAAASMYEKVRAAVDYQEEHLLRRNAIARILKRLLGSDVVIEKMAYDLLRELIWAKYLPNKEIPETFADKLVPVFLKYEPLLRAVDERSIKREEAFNWILDVMSSEVEYAIAPPVNDEALVSFMYEEMKERIAWDPQMELSDEQKDLRLYIAVHKTLLKSNTATLRFRVLTLYYPDWPGASTKQRAKEIADDIETVMQVIDTEISDPLTERLSILLRRKAGVFRVIKDVADANNEDELLALLDNPEALDKEVGKALKKRTADFRTRLKRTVVRSVLFLFLTKMLFALLLEVPFDLIFAREHRYYPLAINILFPPFFLALIALTVTIPERKNTEDYVNAVRAINVGADHDLLNIRLKKNTFGAWSKIFDFAYAFLFILTYGLIAAFLGHVGFNWLSTGLFLFFLSLVTFFGIRIRFSTRDILLSSTRTGILGSMFDLFMLPIVRAGRWLSVKVAQVNVFIYFFDFIIEAPVKVAIRFLEGWISFIREKKEEI